VVLIFNIITTGMRSTAARRDFRKTVSAEKIDIPPVIKIEMIA
jgi:hypothetical protein